MDDAIGNITTSLKENGLYENTVIVFVSDNGGNLLEGASNYPLRGMKGFNYESGTRTISFVHSPLLKKTR